MKVVTGDLLGLARRGQFDVIVHGCNCFCTMGRGIAKGVREAFPEAYEADCRTRSGDRLKLGDYTSARVLRDGMDLVVVNAYTQFNWRGAGPKADYDAISRVFRSIRLAFAGSRIGYPKIGAGLAGGDWGRISALIDETLAGEDHTLVVFEQDIQPRQFSIF